MKVCHEVGVYDVTGWYPLPALALVMNCQQSLHFVHRTSFNDLGWWWGRGDQHHLAFLDWLDLTYMEGWVYPKGPGQMQSNRRRTNNPSDGEGTHELRS